jgi:hypothetical protein
MIANKPQNEMAAQLQVDATVEHMRALYKQGRYQESLDIFQKIERDYPNLIEAWLWIEAAANCIYLERGQKAIHYAQVALARGVDSFVPYDVLAHAYGMLEQWNETRRYGLQALNMRDGLFGQQPIIPLPEPGAMPPLPSAPTRQCNIIAFSLFGGDPKYCEAAVLNVQEQPHVYPHWICRFYVDGSVPRNVIARIQAGGGQIVQIDGTALQWPGPMWRLLALDDRQAHRILFRDADSVISLRKAHAVEQWLASSKRFHMMRDSGAHTELIMAGLWGVVAGSLPPLDKLMERFMNAPLQSQHFADQYFLRQYVWPYARASLMQHDSVFGFIGATPFPNGKASGEPNVGYCESFASFTVKFNAGSVPADGTKVTWALFKMGKCADDQLCEELVCSYQKKKKNGMLETHIPARYARWIQQGTAQVRLSESNTMAHDDSVSSGSTSPLITRHTSKLW